MLISDLQERCKILVAELDTFKAHLESKHRENGIELRSLRSSIQSEARALAKLAEAHPEADRINHTLRSSNLPFYETVWSTAKESTGVTAFSKRFYWNPPPRAVKSADGVQPPKPTTRKPKQYSALVDIVAQNGSEWIKVSTITETRLLFELAKQGWERASSHSDSDSNSEDNSHEEANNDSSEDDISILKTAEDMARASRATRVRYKHPKVRFVLPKIIPGRVERIDDLLADIRATGAQIDLAPSSKDHTSTPDIETAIMRLTVNEFAHFTPTLNVDCTLLLALVSDLSHASVPIQPFFHRAVRRQIEAEAELNLLPATLYPAMGARKLVCTHEAAVRMREIVDVIGTLSERERTDLLLSNEQEGEQDLRRDERLSRLQSLSEYPVPSDLQLPIRIVDKDSATAELPAIAAKVEAVLTPINQSVFLYGWRSGFTTITSNRTVARQIEACIEENRGPGEEDVIGPDVWLCAVSRSLVGKEKGRK